MLLGPASTPIRRVLPAADPPPRSYDANRSAAALDASVVRTRRRDQPGPGVLAIIETFR